MPSLKPPEPPVFVSSRRYTTSVPSFGRKDSTTSVVSSDEALSMITTWPGFGSIALMLSRRPVRR